jgi:hypothetical protein
MINGFPVLLVHATPFHHYEVSLSQVIQSYKIFPKAVVYTKNATLEGAFYLQLLFQGKGEPTRGEPKGPTPPPNHALIW